MNSAKLFVLKKLIKFVCERCRSYRDVFARSLSGTSINLRCTDIGFNFNIKINHDGAVIPRWHLDEESDITLSARLHIWREIFTGKLDYKRAYLTGLLRCQGSIIRLLKGSVVMSTIMKILQDLNLSSILQKLE